jgi:hypothetical protein
LPVKKHDGIQGLVLSAGGNTPLNGEMGDELRNFLLPHVPGVLLVMEQDKLSDPTAIGVFSSDGIVFFRISLRT